MLDNLNSAVLQAISGSEIRQESIKNQLKEIITDIDKEISLAEQVKESVDSESRFLGRSQPQQPEQRQQEYRPQQQQFVSSFLHSRIGAKWLIYLVQGGAYSCGVERYLTHEENEA